MDATAAGLSARAADSDALVFRHSLTTRLTHWIAALAFFVLVMSGLQIFNAAPYLDAANKSDPARRVLAIGAEQSSGGPHGFVQIFGVRVPFGHLLGYTDDGMGGLGERAFPGWITLPGFQDLAGGRRWHLFFGWFFVASGI